MKTTLSLNDQVLQQAKGRAPQDGVTLTKFVEDALPHEAACSLMLP